MNWLTKWFKKKNASDFFAKGELVAEQQGMVIKLKSELEEVLENQE